jgi:AcrR family transcriptional regulator
MSIVWCMMMGMVDDRECELPPGLALAWGVPAVTRRRGPKPAHTVQQIVQVAMEVADAEGFAGLSMPKIAGRLGITANALYRYVSSKDELVVLLNEAGWGLPPESIRHAGHWRDAAVQWTHAVIERTRVHPWLLDIPIRGAPITPHLLGWLEVFLEAMASSGLSVPDLVSCALLLDGYARSIANLSRDLDRSGAPATLPPAVVEFVQPLLLERGLPRVAAMMAGGDYEESDVSDADLDFGLNRILSGIECLIISQNRQTAREGGQTTTHSPEPKA